MSLSATYLHEPSFQEFFSVKKLLSLTTQNKINISPANIHSMFLSTDSTLSDTKISSFHIIFIDFFHFHFVNRRRNNCHPMMLSYLSCRTVSKIFIVPIICSFSLFSAHIYNMEGKSSTQNAEIERFLTLLPMDNVRRE